MSIHTLQLLEIPGNYKKGTLVYGPRAHVALESGSVIELPSKSGEKVKFHTLSPECVVFSEVDCQINRLIEELQTIRNRAKKFFQKEKDRELKWLSQSKQGQS